MDGHADAQGAEDGVNHLHEVNLTKQGVGTDDVGIALVELAIASALGTVGAPDGLHLETLEGESYLVAVHDDIAGKGHGEVIAKPLLAELRGKMI